MICPGGGGAVERRSITRRRSLPARALVMLSTVMWAFAWESVSLVGDARADNPALSLATGPAVTEGSPSGAAKSPTTGGPFVATAIPGLVGPPVDFQPRMLIQTDAVVEHHGPDAPAIEDGRSHPGFYLRRARIGGDVMSGIWRGRGIVEAAAQPETVASVSSGGVASTGGGARPDLDPIAGTAAGDAPRVTEAYVALTAGKGFSLGAGSLRVPLGLSRQIDEADLRLPERARFVVRATPDYRVGVAAGGDLGLFQYALGVYGAAPSRLGSDFTDGGFLYVARLSGEPVGPLGIAPHLRRRDDPWYGWWRFSVGASTFLAQLPGRNEWGLGGDGQFQWARLCVTGELLWTRRAPVDRLGFTVEPGLFIVPDIFELVARFEFFNDDVGPRSPLDAWGASLGATLFSPGRHARLQAAYTLRRPSAGGSDPSGWAVVRAMFTL